MKLNMETIKNVNSKVCNLNIGWLVTYVFIFTLFFDTQSVFQNGFGPLNSNVVNNLVICLMYIICVYVSVKHTNLTKISFALNLRKHISFYLLSIIPIGIYLFRDINNDQIYHAQKSFEVLQIILPSNFYEEQTSLKFGIRIGLIIFMLFIMVHFWLLTKGSLTNIFVSFGEIVFALNSKIAIQDPHPPLRNLFNIVSQAIFGINGFSIRIVGMACLMLGFVMMYGMLTRVAKLPRLLVDLTIILISTFPIVFYSANIGETSIIAGITLSVLYTYLVVKRNIDFKTIYLINFVLSFVSLVRQSMALSIILSMTIIFVTAWRKGLNLRIIKESFFLLTPWVLAIPFLNQTRLKGTPATYIQKESMCFPEYSNLFDRLSFVIENNLIFKVISLNNSVFLIFFTIMVILTSFNKKNIIVSAIPVFSIIFAIQFFSIRPILWATARYQVEYFLPLVVFSIVLVLQFRALRKFLFFSIPILILLNLVNNFSTIQTIQSGKLVISNENISCDLNYVKFISEQKFSYSKSIRENIPKNSKVLVLGNTYGVYPLMINQSTYENFISNLDLRNNFYASGDPRAYILDNKIEYIVTFDISATESELIRNLIISNKYELRPFNENEVKIYSTGSII
jgi:hypothetical protein